MLKVLRGSNPALSAGCVRRAPLRRGSLLVTAARAVPYTGCDAYTGRSNHGDRLHLRRLRLRELRDEAADDSGGVAGGGRANRAGRHSSGCPPDQPKGDARARSSPGRSFSLLDASGDRRDCREQQLPVGPGQAGRSEPARDPAGSGHRQLEQDSFGAQSARASLAGHLLGRSRPDPGRDCDRPAADRRPSPAEGQPLLPQERHSPIQAPGRLHRAAAPHGSGPRRSADRPRHERSSLLDLPDGARQGALRHPPRHAPAAGLPWDLPDAHSLAANDGALVERHVHRELGPELPTRHRLCRLPAHTSPHLAGRRRRDDREAGHETSGLCDPLARCERAQGSR